MPRPHYLLFQDKAGEWCASPPGFRDLALDPTGWGHTPDAAIVALLSHPEYLERAFMAGWPQPCRADFIEGPEPEGAQIDGISYAGESSDSKARRRRRAFKLVE
jgi:hypothetical protein